MQGRREDKKEEKDGERCSICKKFFTKEEMKKHGHILYAGDPETAIQEYD